LGVGTCALWGSGSACAALLLCSGAGRPSNKNRQTLLHGSPCLTMPRHASHRHFPDLTADNCPRDRSDPIDDLQSRQRCALHSSVPVSKGLESNLQITKSCPLVVLLLLLLLSTVAAPRPSLPALPSLPWSWSWSWSWSWTSDSANPNSHVAPYPSGQSCTTFFSCAAASWLLNLNSWNYPIHAFFFCTYIRKQGCRARVALGIPPTCGRPIRLPLHY
jgi:hypothetical protein